MIVRARCQSFVLSKLAVIGKVANPKYLPSHVHSSKIPSHGAIDNSFRWVKHAFLSAVFF